MTKFTPELCDKLCKLRSIGLDKQSCAKKCRINPKTITRWLEKGRNARSGKHHDFYMKWQEADADFELVHLQKIIDNKDWRSSQYLLQVTNPEKYVVVNKTENKNTNTHSFEELFDDEEIRRQSNELKRKNE